MGLCSVIQRSVSQSVLDRTPARLLRRLLLEFPWLYSRWFINYESRLDYSGISDLHACLHECLHVGGDVIECGSDRCGSAALMGLWLNAAGSEKLVFACDSFAGFDRTELGVERQRGLTAVSDHVFTATSYPYVCRKLDVLGLWKRVRPVKGYFCDTLTKLQGPFALAFIDCDLEESVYYCAKALFGRLSSGGYMIFDDYLCDDYKGARRAIDRLASELTSEATNLGLRRRLYVLQKK